MANNDLDAPTTRRDLRDLKIELVDRMQALGSVCKSSM
jgi:hypothetical protein